ncbi:MAG: dTDP-4-keto-6-deoxy-D-glucose epimerase [Spirochaetaceae bacterium]|nr:MAG: dTDP-4-keto-6-deoxy-D-glucose epimerase [Spirochaetaceae bacterium]
MKILDISEATLPSIKLVRFARFADNRGYFTEPYRKSDFAGHPELGSLGTAVFVQMNESFSNPGVIRGLHFQWNPFMGKLVRTVKGRMVDIVLDIRKDSPCLGKAMLFDMKADTSCEYGEWIWVPPGFAHGNFFTEETHIEYMCTGEYSPGNEAGISPACRNIDWSLADKKLFSEMMALFSGKGVMSDKDKNGLSLAAWLALPAADLFTMDKCGRT